MFKTPDKCLMEIFRKKGKLKLLYVYSKYTKIWKHVKSVKSKLE